VDRRAGEEGRDAVRRLARIDRRVEICFFDPGQEPRLACHPRRGQCLPDACEIFKQRIFQLDPLPWEPVPSPAGTIRIRLLDRFGEPHKRTTCDVDVPGLGTSQATSDDKGWIQIKCPSEAGHVALTLQGVRGGGTRRVLLKPAEGDDAKGTLHRLANLGFSGAQQALQRFWRPHAPEPVDTAPESDLDDIESKCKTLDDPGAQDTSTLNRQVHDLAELGERT
jgi:hypothetical protein